MPSMLPGAPWLVAHKSMLPINQPRKISLYGNDYVMWKAVNGDIHALPNACPHMGAMLSEGWCEAGNDGSSRVTCPFHALAFDAKGHTVLPGSAKQTLPQLEPLELIIQGDFVWTYGGYEPKIPIPIALKDIAAKYSFIGHAADITVETDLLSMLLNMHDYNHQNGTHRDLFRINEVQFHKFIDQGHESHAYYDMPTAPYSLAEKLRRPDLFLLPETLKAHLENHFPSLVIFHGRSALGTLAQCHLFVPEAENRTRTYVLMFSQAKHPVFNLVGRTYLNFAQVVVEQDADILGKLYPDSPQTIKLNNEVGMDWVRRNFASFPEVTAPDLGRENDLPKPELSAQRL
ncbi:Rieske 2Fe-2S domain-containing protein [Nodosilinea sp. LEGE 07088]|uniref:Rieske 2Fe-2S domain-containing protein n=1 Tax=Nodosilinea sp. LEGE 07088 TaxID=2777968 RepID=UPI00187F914C|nr:Rieske 2Fe-2S domain-containing protein [Nodosilinea sp. LEGE 07088]MBE9137525.1 Rieske 2Fe-2S domain-containing protein [Nodosilinea sp. LEGE 07088]